MVELLHLHLSSGTLIDQNIMSQPLVSIILPTLRRPGYLEIALKSVLAQDYSPLQIIVSDNGSGDQTPKVVSQLIKNDSRVFFRSNDQTVDLPQHLNQCLELVKGEYFVIVSDDDWISPNFISELVKALKKNPRAIAGITQSTLINEKGEVIQNIPSPPWTDCSGLEFLLDWLYSRQTLGTYTFFSLMMPTDKIQKIGGFPNFPVAANSDNALMLYLALQGDFVYVREANFHYRFYHSSYGMSLKPHLLALSSSSFEKWTSQNPAVQQLLSKLKIKEQRQIKVGLKKMLKSQYLGRFQSGQYELGWKEFRDAIIHYSFNFHFLFNLLKTNHVFGSNHKRNMDH